MRATLFDSFRRLALAMLLASTGLGLTACESLRPPVATSEDGLVRVRIRTPGTLFVHPVDHVDHYDDVTVGEFGIDYADGQEPFPDRVAQRLYAKISEIAGQAVPERGYRLAKTPGPCTLKLNLYLVDLALYSSGRAGGRTTYLRSYGGVTVVFELRTSVGNEPLLRFAQRRDLGGGSQEGLVNPNLTRLGQALDEIVGNAADGMLRAVKRSSVGAKDSSCEGAIGEARRIRNEEVR